MRAQEQLSARKTQQADQLLSGRPLRGEPARPAAAALGEHVGDLVEYAGALLRDVVAGAGPAFHARRRKDRSRFLIAVSGGDGHHAVLAWSELDEDFGDSPVLLATRLDGEELDEAGAQLVVPSDWCGARYVSAVTHVWFGALAAPDL
ncbi:molybdopterin-dependent oxidoreductase [Streptomyces sp. NBC_01233]|uniref:molybdopterin-dependent oxidoreductase n=1 Tax=Streptomyces sp. NBC_01233 TaxID=2903787 RepID=UPI002E1005C3|nr:molybdopterin-dependent oxidoreductase [Streptomyces sp. NBC_01233]